MRLDKLLSGILNKCDKINKRIEDKPESKLLVFVRPKLSEQETSGQAIATAQKKVI